MKHGDDSTHTSNCYPSLPPQDYRANAEKAKRELQGTEVRNRPLKIRYASITTGVRVKNLTACVSNELLEKAFNVFGQVSECVWVSMQSGEI